MVLPLESVSEERDYCKGEFKRALYSDGVIPVNFLKIELNVPFD
jgi:hypothetical protein